MPYRTPSGQLGHIGIVACSAEGAALCYRTICGLSAAALGRHDHPRITMDAIPLAAWMPAFAARDHARLAGIMLESTHILAAAGADFAVCPDNSAHIAWDRVAAATPIPWLHIARIVADEAGARGYERVGVLGTRFTMGADLYPRALAGAGVGAVLPDRTDAEVVHHIIFSELIDGVVTADARLAYQRVIAKLADRGCDAVALACTEIPLLIRPQDSPLPTLDSTRLLAAAALRKAGCPPAS